MNRSINAVYLMHSLNSLAGSFIGIFVPIYFLSLTYSVTQVFAYYVVYVIAVFILFLFVSLIAQKIGLRRTLISYFPFQFTYLVLLYVLPHMAVPLWCIAVASALSIAFYWYPLHLFFVAKAEEKSMGSSVGKLYALPKFITIVSPLIGGFIVVRGGFSSLIVLTIALYLLTACVLPFLPDYRPAIRFRISKFLTLAKTYPRYMLAEIGENLREELEGIVLPIIIFITFGSVFSVGIIGTFAKIGSGAFMLLVGRYADRLKRTRILRIGAIITMAVWVAFFYAQGALSFYILTLLEGFFGALLLIPFNALVYDYAQRNDAPAEFIVFREVPVTLARVLVYGTGLLLVSSPHYLFLLPVAGGVLFWLL